MVRQALSERGRRGVRRVRSMGAEERIEQGGSTVARMRLKIAKREKRQALSDACQEHIALSSGEESKVESSTASWQCMVNGESSKCIVCWDYLTGAIYQCREGHLLCDACSSNRKLLHCPVCRASIAPEARIRARAFEDLLAGVSMPCRWECGFVGLKAERSVHEKSCALAPFGCILCGLSFRGDASAVIEHMRYAHTAVDIMNRPRGVFFELVARDQGTSSRSEHLPKQRPDIKLQQAEHWCLPIINGKREGFSVHLMRRQDSVRLAAFRLVCSDGPQGEIEQARKLQISVVLNDEERMSLRLNPQDLEKGESLKKLKRKLEDNYNLVAASFPTTKVANDKIKVRIRLSSPGNLLSRAGQLLRRFHGLQNPVLPTFVPPPPQTDSDGDLPREDDFFWDNDDDDDDDDSFRIHLEQHNNENTDDHFSTLLTSVIPTRGSLEDEDFTSSGPQPPVPVNTPPLPGGQHRQFVHYSPSSSTHPPPALSGFNPMPFSPFRDRPFYPLDHIDPFHHYGPRYSASRRVHPPGHINLHRTSDRGGDYSYRYHHYHHSRNDSPFFYRDRDDTYHRRRSWSPPPRRATNHPAAGGEHNNNNEQQQQAAAAS